MSIILDVDDGASLFDASRAYAVVVGRPRPASKRRLAIMPLQVMDRFALVRLFLRVAETGQISEAARTLGLSQPTASRALKRLEALVGARLIDRSPQGARLTPAGQDFLAPARRLIDGWQEAVDLVTGDSFSGPVRVAVPVAVGQGFLVGIAARFMRIHPDITIEWHLRDDAVDVAAGGYDL